MPVHHTLGYRLTVGALAVVAMVALAAVAVPLLRRGWGDHDAQLRATQDSLVVARTQTTEALSQMRARDEILGAANHSLDSILRVPPRVLYVRRPTPKASPGLLGDTLRPDPAPGDTMEALVPLPAYEALASRCRSLSAACDSAQAAKDTVIARQQGQIAAQGSIITQQAAAARRSRRAAVVARIRDWGVGGLVGAAVCAFLCD